MTPQASDHECLAYNQPAWLCRAVLGCASLSLAVPCCAGLCLAGCAWLRLAAQGDHPGAVLLEFPCREAWKLFLGIPRVYPAHKKNLPTVFRFGWGAGGRAGNHYVEGLPKGLPRIYI